MTVESATTKVSAAGNGVATVFSFSPLVIYQSSDLVVVKTDASGVETTLAENTDYIVSVASYPGAGSISYPVSGAKLANGEKLTMKRVLPIEQQMALSPQGGYFPNTQETAFDKLTIIAQQQKESIDRAIKFPVSDSVAPIDLPTAALRAGKALVFDANGQPTAGQVPASGVISAPMVPVVGAATLADARTAFGFSAYIQTLLDDADAATARATLLAAKAQAGTGLALATDVLSIDASYMRGFLSGLQLTNNATTPNTKIDVSAGVCADSTNAALMKLVAGTINCATVGADGLDAGALAVNTWYHAYAIGKADGTTARLASTSASAPAMPSGYTLKRRLGSFKTNSGGNIIAFVQDGDYFQWRAAPIADVSSGTLTTANRTLVPVSVPSGLNLVGLFSATIVSAGAANQRIYLSDPTVTDVAASNAAVSLAFASTAVNQVVSGMVRCRTDTASQIGVRGDSAVTYFLNTHGWYDTRGRFS